MPPKLPISFTLPGIVGVQMPYGLHNAIRSIFSFHPPKPRQANLYFEKGNFVPLGVE
jgi:hypothetical protein